MDIFCVCIKSAVEKLKFKSVQLHQRNIAEGKLVFLSQCGLILCTDMEPNTPVWFQWLGTSVL